MKYRPQRGGFKESMAEAVDIQPATMAALARYLDVRVERVSFGKDGLFDHRNGWETWTVLIDGYAVGFIGCGEKVLCTGKYFCARESNPVLKEVQWAVCLN